MDRAEYFSRSRYYQQTQLKKQHKPLATALKRIAYTKIQFIFGSLHRHSSNYGQKMSRLNKISLINGEVCLAIAFRKIKAYSIEKRVQNFIMKNCVTLGAKVRTKFISYAFEKLHANALVLGSKANKKLQEVRNTMMGRSLKKLYMKSKTSAWQKLKQNTIQCRIKKRVNSIHTIFRGSQKRNILYSWIKILNFNSKIIGIQQAGQLQDFSLQLQDMKIQIQNKNQNIARLQQQITQLKHSCTARPNDTSSFVLNSSMRNRSATQIYRNKSKLSNFDAESNEGSVARDPSFGSLLGNSMLSWRSRASNKSNKAKDCQCQTCNYRDKYEKYKATNETLKKQLQIIKTELQFTKDMNEHMQNQIKSFFSNEDMERKMEKLRIDLKQCQRQRQGLREKVVKYEKYVTKLKIQFKTKIEEIYRRVKKNG